MPANIKDLVNYEHIHLARINMKDKRYIISITHKYSRILAMMLSGVPYEQFTRSEKIASFEIRRWFAELNIESEIQTRISNAGNKN